MSLVTIPKATIGGGKDVLLWPLLEGILHRLIVLTFLPFANKFVGIDDLKVKFGAFEGC